MLPFPPQISEDTGDILVTELTERRHFQFPENTSHAHGTAQPVQQNPNGAIHRPQNPLGIQERRSQTFESDPAGLMASSAERLINATPFFKEDLLWLIQRGQRGARRHTWLLGPRQLAVQCGEEWAGLLPRNRLKRTQRRRSSIQINEFGRGALGERFADASFQQSELPGTLRWKRRHQIQKPSNPRGTTLGEHTAGQDREDLGADQRVF